MWVQKARAAVKMPIFASLNAVNPGSWTSYAKQLAETGIDGLELNYYYVAADMGTPGTEIEKRLVDIVASVKAEVDIPIAVKLSPYYSSVANLVKQLEEAGANAVVMFNRFLQPDIDLESETIVNDMRWSDPSELKMPLRWVALLYGRTNLDMALNTGVHTGQDIAKAVLAGANAVQVASTLFINGLPYISTMLMDLQNWMDDKGYDSIADMKGKVSQQNTPDPFGFERAQYMQLLMSQQ